MSAYKPKIYRSQDGCCICKAKSSSSRFTDSGKYEEDSMGCFRLKESRSGDICNACVLIVKRWKKLPRSNTKTWAHVVDARTGPGTKNIFKQKKKEKGEVDSESFKTKHVYKRKPARTVRRIEEEGELSDSAFSSRSLSPALEVVQTTPSFLANSYWQRTAVCCGVVFVGQLGEVVLDQAQYQCCSRLPHQPIPLQPSPSPSSANEHSSIESLVEAELQAFQAIDREVEEDEFYPEKRKGRNNNDYSGDEGFCDRIDQRVVDRNPSSSLPLVL